MSIGKADTGFPCVDGDGSDTVPPPGIRSLDTKETDDMFANWAIRTKLLLGLALLLVSVTILSFSSFRGVYAYRAVVKGMSRRASELPLATLLTQRVTRLQALLEGIKQSVSQDPMRSHTESASRRWLARSFEDELRLVRDAVEDYRDAVVNSPRDVFSGGAELGGRQEQKTLQAILGQLACIEQFAGEDWAHHGDSVDLVADALEELARQSARLPTFLQERMGSFADTVRGLYRTWLVLNWVTTISAVVITALIAQLFYQWILCPLSTLIQGSRRVASGDFSHRIQLTTKDEVTELADAMNAMTSRFQEIRDDLDRQVWQRTQEVVRGEQLASVGFLAAGVAHEINNPLAAIALCAESLEDRLHDIILKDDSLSDEEHNESITVLRHYLRTIQDEAFRCSGITEKLLDFSRIGDEQRVPTELVELTRDVLSMLEHLGNHKGKRIEFQPQGEVVAVLNPQEYKQVVLNLVTNALDSLDPGGKVVVELVARNGQAELTVTDNGCGMSDEVLKHIFEPFFTRRRNGQGTGLGMSIAHRIVSEHGGRIQVQSEGPGKGSRVQISFALSHEEPHSWSRSQAA